MRQDAFKETVYEGKKNTLLIFAQIVTAFYILKIFGGMLTYHINSGFYLSSMLKRLYLVKGTSLAKVTGVENPSTEHISDLMDRVETSRNRNMHANILAWKQIDHDDCKNLLSTIM